MNDHAIKSDIELVCAIPMVPGMLKVLTDTTGLRITAIARVTEDRWVACSVRDEAGFGLKPADELAIDTTFCKHIRRTGQLVHFDDANSDPRYVSHPSPPMYGFRSYVSVPISLPDGAFFGTLCGLDPEPRRVGTEAILGMFQLFAGIIGEQIAIHRRLTERETDLADERSKAVLREQFVAVLGHDLRSPLASIQSCLLLLEEAVVLPKEGGDFTRIARQNVGRMARLIDDVLDLTRSRLGGGIALRLVTDGTLAGRLDQVIEEIAISYPSHRFERRLAIGPPVRCDVDRVCQLFANLLNNAVAHGAPDRPIRVDAVGDAEGLTIEVANAGTPINDAIRDRLFEPFVRNALDGGQGLGLGLFIAKEIALAHGGTLGFTSDAVETRFAFQMQPL